MRILQFFLDLKISTKLILSFTCVAAIAAANGWIGLRSLNSAGKLGDQIYGEHLLPLRELANTRGNFLSSRIQVRAAAAERDSSLRRQYIDSVYESDRLTDEHLAAFLQSDLNEKEKALGERFRSELEEYRRQREPILKAIAARKNNKAEKLMNGEARVLGIATNNTLSELMDTLARDAQQVAEQNKAQVAAAASKIFTFIVAGLIAALGFGVVIARAVGKPARRMEEAARKLAEGDVDVRVNVTGKDELGMLAQSFHEMAEMIQLRVAEAQKIAAGDLDLEIKARSDKDVLAASLSSLVGTLKGLMQQMAQMSAEHDAGDIDATIDASKFQGAYREVASGINGMIAGHIAVKKKAMACIAEFGRGNFEAPLEKFPGKKAFINDTIEGVRGDLKRLIADTEMLSSAAIHGRLATRADGSRHHGDFRKIVDGINYTLDTIVGKFDAIPKPIQFIDSKFKVQYMNKAGIELLGRNADAILGSRCGYNTAACGTPECTCAQAMEIDGLTRLETNARINNKQYEFTCAAVPLKDANGVTIGAFELLDDDTMVKRAIQQAEKVARYQEKEARKMAVSLNQLASGELDIHVEVDPGDQDTAAARRAYEEISTALMKTADSVRKTMRRVGATTATMSQAAQVLNTVSQSMTASADQTAAQANMVSAASEQVSKNVQTVAAGADEMGASIREIAKNTGEASKVAEAAVRTAEATNGRVEKLGHSSAEIGQVIKVITSIAQQTNLLALNATIEAARAGEAGKGFAVVANEVKELAKATASATEEISRKIEAIQADTKDAVAAIGEVGSVISQISDIQTTIASAVEEQSATTSEISRNLAEAAKGGVDISQNIGGVAQAAHSTTEGAAETLRSAQTLQQLAQELAELIAHFKYDRSSTEVSMNLAAVHMPQETAFAVQ